LFEALAGLVLVCGGLMVVDLQLFFVGPSAMVADDKQEELAQRGCRRQLSAAASRPVVGKLSEQDVDDTLAARLRAFLIALLEKFSVGSCRCTC
jgi:hypothetical protein